MALLNKYKCDICKKVEFIKTRATDTEKMVAELFEDIEDICAVCEDVIIKALSKTIRDIRVVGGRKALADKISKGEGTKKIYLKPRTKFEFNLKKGLLTSKREAGNDPKTMAALWECKCMCGKTKIVNASTFKQGSPLSCGCLYDTVRAYAKQRRLSFSMAKASLYSLNKRGKELSIDADGKIHIV